MSLPRYPEYKASGVEWLGEVPGHWEVWKLSHAFDVIGSGTTPKSDNTAYYDDGQTAWVNTGDLNDGELFDCEKRVTDLALTEHSALKIFPPGSLVIAMYGATIGKLAILRFPSTVNQACCVFVEGVRVQSIFLFYWFLGLRQQIISLATGGGQPNISQEILRGLRLACPLLEEQQTIAAFLDRETGKIDALIAEQRRLVELLAEKRQAVISHAVTKGLNPTTPMKNSGIEWLGEVPGHWEVLPLKRRCALLKDGTHLPPPRVSEGVPLLSVRNIQNGRFDLRDDDSLISQENYQDLCKSFIPQPNDVLLAIVGATLGKTALVPIGIGFFHIQRSVAIFRPTAEMLAQYLHFLFQSGGFQQLLWEYVGYSAQPGIYLGTLAEFRITLPTLAEQSAIVAFIDTETAKFDTLTAEAQRAIALLQERRSALISAAVTGKIDVRGVCA